MADIINFNKARKQKALADAEKQAAENRVRFGRTKAQQQLDRIEDELAKQRLEQLRREKHDEETE